jgi:asparagine synthase (glutamine-hydrolysing)
VGDYLLVCLISDDDVARTRSAQLAHRASRETFSLSTLNAGAWLGVKGPHAPRVLRASNWTLVGDVFDRRAPTLPGSRPGDPWDYERKMAARFWGRFIGVQFGVSDKPVALLRDPSGALECVAWVQDGLLIVCSAAFDWLLTQLRPHWRISLHRIDQALRDPLSGTGDLLLEGPVALAPGAIQPLPLEQEAVEIWQPSSIARSSLAAWPSPEEAAGRLRAAVDETVSALANLSGPLAAEVSGGLDSSIVAASLQHVAPDATTLWLNAYGAGPEADERTYAVALGRKLGFAPVCVPHARAPMTEEWFCSISQSFRPGLNGLDRPQDMEWARRLAAHGATGLMTGRGGDTILLQNATIDVFIDRWRLRGWRALLSDEVRELAASNEKSLWTFASEALRRSRQDHSPPGRACAILAPPRGPWPLHPWLRDWDAFGPAKAFQIAGLADSVSRHSPSGLSRTIDVRNPLCAQPVIEACLALPAPVLTLGARERGLARHAFRDRLPAQIIDRRSKGDMTRIYGRLILDNLAFLRGWLLDGRLAALGVIDADAADRALTREALVWRGGSSAIMVAAAFEGWVRTWERRLGPVR